MEFKILAPFQTENRFFRDNVNTGWQIEKPKNIANQNFHYFKYINIDRDWHFARNTRYLFPIYYEAESNIMEEAIKFVKENLDLFGKKILIPVFLDPLEGNDYIAPDIDYFCNRFYNSFPVYYISADYKLKFRKNLFKFIYNDQWVKHVKPQDKPITYDVGKTFINLNRVARFHRCLLMQSIIDAGMLKEGYNTWANTYDAYSQFAETYPDNTINNQTYDILDVKDITAANPTQLVPIEHCKKTMIYVNTETHVDNNVLFISEKTYKPISIGMPFMTLGNPGTLELLREMGYATFSRWIDESYDVDRPIEDRIRVIVDNLTMLNGMHRKQKLKVRNEMREVCQHNLELYKLHNRKNSLIENLSLIKAGWI